MYNANRTNIPSRPRAVLNEAKVIEIYKLRQSIDRYRLQPSRSAALASYFNVSPKAIRDIWNRRTWANETRHLWTEDERPTPRSNKKAVFPQCQHASCTKGQFTDLSLNVDKNCQAQPSTLSSPAIFHEFYNARQSMYTPQDSAVPPSNYHENFRQLVIPQPSTTFGHPTQPSPNPGPNLDYAQYLCFAPVPSKLSVTVEPQLTPHEEMASDAASFNDPFHDDWLHW